MRKMIMAGVCVATLAACEDDAGKASYNLSKAADNFEIVRRIVFFNGITGEYMLEMVGRCSIEDQTNQLEVVCKDDAGRYEKHFLGLSDNVSYLSQQVGGADVSVNHTRITFRPQSILPDIDFRGDAQDLVTPRDETSN